ncbi:MAG: PEP-CTERM sorting domain-containing protein [Gemmataceae bacterium]
MPSRTLSRLLLAAMVLAVPARFGRAEPIRWTYYSIASPGFHAPGAGTGAPSVDPSGPPAWVSFWGGYTGEVTGSSSIPLAYAAASGWVGPGEVATFQRQPLQIDLAITDLTTGAFGIASFQPYLDGTITSQGVNLTVTFPELTKTLHLGKNSYTIAVGTATLSGAWATSDPLGSSAPIHSLSGVIDATVQANSQPEPSTLVLLGVAGSLGGLVYSRRRRRAKRGDA